MRTEKHRALIDVTLQRHGLRPDQLLIVDNIRDWCVSHGAPKSSPDPPGLCLCGTADGDCLILLAAELTEDMFASIRDAMEVRGFSRELAALGTNEENLLHLVLHEIACHVLSDTGQVSRDAWAFAELAKIRTEPY